MKILITNQYMMNRTGSELFTVELAQLLTEHGHEVYIYSPVTELAVGSEVVITDDLQSIANIDFDIIHAQHNITALLARSVFPNVPIVYMSHGILPSIEQPPSVPIGVALYIAVSEEVQDNLVNNHNIDVDKVKIVCNAVDTEKYHSFKPVNKELKNILVVSNHYSSEVRFNITEAAKRVGANVRHIGLPHNVAKDVAKEINKADLVVTLGRGVLEACACERNVLVYDIHGLDGMVDEGSFHKLRTKNFSGRFYAKQCSPQDILQEFKKYDLASGVKLRSIVKKDSSVIIAVEQLEEIYLKAIKIGVNGSLLESGMLQRELTFLFGEYNACWVQCKYKRVLLRYGFIRFFISIYKYLQALLFKYKKGKKRINK